MVPMGGKAAHLTYRGLETPPYCRALKRELGCAVVSGGGGAPRATLALQRLAREPALLQHVLD